MDSPKTKETRFEERLVHAVLLAVGGLGVVLGLVSPKCTTEMALGSLMVLSVAHAKARELLEERRRLHAARNERSVEN
jgi:hypothetical protein